MVVVRGIKMVMVMIAVKGKMVMVDPRSGVRRKKVVVIEVMIMVVVVMVVVVVSSSGSNRNGVPALTMVFVMIAREK